MNKEDIIDYASQNFEFIKDLSDPERKQLFEKISLAKVKKDKILMNEGVLCEGIVLVLDGVIRIYKVSEEGREITLYRIGKGETCVLTVSCVMGSTEYQAIAQVEEDATLLSIPSDIFKRLFSTSQGLQKFVFDTLAERLSEVMIIVDEIAFQRMDKRIAAFLIEKVDSLGSDIIKITHEEIAMELGSAREVISRMLKDFEKRELLALSRGTIHVLKPALLKKLSIA